MTRPLIAVVLTTTLTLAAHAQRLDISPVAPGVWRGKAPYPRRDYEAIRALGVRTVIDLRGNQPFASAIERRRVEAMGLTYRKVPARLQPLREWDDTAVLAALTNAADYPMYVHCNVGHDRISVAVAGFRVKVQGLDPRAAEAEARQIGLRRVFLGLNRYLRKLGE